MDNELLDQYVRAFRNRRDGLAAFTTQVEVLLKTLLNRNGISFQDVHGRCKSVESYREKIRRKGYTNPDQQLMDAVGVRAVVFFDADVDLVAELIQREFNVDVDHSEDKRSPENELAFGYRSYHLIATLNESRASSTEYAPFRDQRIEFQVRSMLAHTWEAIDRQMDYKQAPGLSSKGKRLMSRVSAMLETADELFNQLRDSELAVRAAREAENEPEPQQSATNGKDAPTLTWD